MRASVNRIFSFWIFIQQQAMCGEYGWKNRFFHFGLNSHPIFVACIPRFRIFRRTIKEDYSKKGFIFRKMK